MIPSIVVAVLAIPVLVVIAIIMSIGARERIKRLEFRIAGLEAQLAAIGGATPLEPESSPAPKTQPEASPSEPHAAAPAGPAAAKSKVSLEERFGTQWVV